jgi:hypothetical protein
MAEFREIVELAPTCPLPYLHTALLLASLGDVPSALAHLDAACALCAEGTEAESFDAVRISIRHQHQDQLQQLPVLRRLSYPAHPIAIATRRAGSRRVRLYADGQRRR